MSQHNPHSRRGVMRRYSLLILVVAACLIATAFRKSPLPDTRQQCPTISCAESQSPGVPIQFTVDPGSYSPSYSWTVSSGTITSGQNSSQITVEDVPAGQSCEAAVAMGGLGSRCRN